MLSMKNSLTEQPARPEEAHAQAQAQEDAQEEAQEDAQEERGLDPLPERRELPECREGRLEGTLITLTII